MMLSAEVIPDGVQFQLVIVEVGQVLIFPDGVIFPAGVMAEVGQIF